MSSIENFLVQYATFNWKDLYFDIRLNQNVIYISFFIFVFIFIIKWICDLKNHKMLSSKITQTDYIVHDCSKAESKNADSNELILESIFNHKFFRYYLFNCWIKNYNEFLFSKNISKKCRIVEFNEENCKQFKISQITSIDNKEMITFTFQLKCVRLFFTMVLLSDQVLEHEAHVILTDIELSVLVMMEIGDHGLLLKLFPDCVSNFSCELNAEEVDKHELELCLAEFKRDFKFVMMQTLELEFNTRTICSTQKIFETSKVDNHCQVKELSHIKEEMQIHNQEMQTGSTQSVDEVVECIDEQVPKVESSKDDPTIESEDFMFYKIGKEMKSLVSLFTTDSYDFYDQGEESPFHDRASSKLIGSTLVVGLVKVIEAHELKSPLKNGYCVLELDEPYQRHVSHLISLIDYPVWNQHFVFSLNSNSQRISIELFHASKKCQNPTSLGVSIIPINLIMIDPTENYFPIFNNQFGNRKSWRCDVIAGGVDSKIPAFLIDFQIMKNVHDIMKVPADPPSEISSDNSGMSNSRESSKKTSENNVGDLEKGHKMLTIPEAQVRMTDHTPDNTLTKNRSNEESKVLLRDKPNDENGRSKSMINKIRHRFSRLSVPWMNEKSKSDDCLDQITDENDIQMSHCTGVPVQPPAELFMGMSKPKMTKISEIDLRNSRSLSISLKKVLNLPIKKMGKVDHFKEKSFEQLFKEMDSKMFDAISNEGFNRIMNNE